jgi:hypothetical protein
VVFRRRISQQGFFTEMALIEQMVSANTPEELQQVLDAHAPAIVNRRMLRTFRKMHKYFLREGENELAHHAEILVRVIENALRKGIPQAIALERRLMDDITAATIAIVRAAPWEMEDIVRQHAEALQIPEFLDRLRRLDRLIHQQEGAEDAPASQFARSLKIDYAKDAIEHGIAYAEQRFKARYQAYMREHNAQFPE